MKALFKTSFGLMVILSFLMMVGVVHPALAQDDGLFADLENIPVLLPDVPQVGELDATTINYRYLIMAQEGDVITVDMVRTSGEIVPRLYLFDAAGNEILQRTAVETADSSVVGTQLVFFVEATNWYFLVANSLPGVNTPNLEGAFSLMLAGTTNDIYEEIGEEAPPTTVEDARVLRGSIVLSESFITPAVFLANMKTGDTLSINTGSQMTTMIVQNLDEDELLRRGTVITNFTSEADEWVIVTLESTIPDILTVTVEWTTADSEVFAPEAVTFRNLPDIGQAVAQGLSNTNAGPLITCEVVARDNTNKRNGPGTAYTIVGRLRYQRTATVIAQSKDEQNWTWWQLDDTTWVREDGVEEGDGCENVTVFGQEDTSGPPEGIAACLLTALGDSNLRLGPGTDFGVGGSLRYQTEVYAIGQYRGRTSQYTWWQTVDGFWIREDSVTEDGECNELPVTWN